MGAYRAMAAGRVERGWLWGLMLVAVLALPGAARAGDDGWRVSLEANTMFPIDVGARLFIESPTRVRISTSVGWLPQLYLRTINSLAESTGAYDENVSGLIERSLENSLVWRLHLGWQPFEGAGFYFDGGYGLIALGGRTTAEEVFLALLGLPPPEGETALNRKYEFATTLHQFDVEVGWQWNLGRHATMRTGLAFLYTIRSATRIQPEFEPLLPEVTNVFTRLVEDTSDGFLEDNVHFPAITFSIGYVF